MCGCDRCHECSGFLGSELFSVSHDDFCRFSIIQIVSSRISIEATAAAELSSRGYARMQDVALGTGL